MDSEQKNFFGGMIVVALGILLGFMVGTLINPEGGVVLREMNPSVVQKTLRDGETRLVHETNMKHLTNSSQVQDEVDEIRMECRFDRECMVEKVKNMSDDINSTFEYRDEWPEPKTVLERGEGRCVAKAVLVASLLEGLNIDAYYAYQERHACVMYVLDGERDFIGCFNEEFYLISPA